MQERQRQTRERQSIWSVPGHLWHWYVGLFVVQYFIFLGLTIWNETGNRSGDGAVQVILNVQKGMTAGILNMAASTYIILEGVMLAQWLRERDRRKEEEAAEKVRQWQSWYARMQTARKEGLSFDEPPPGQKKDEGNE